MVGAIDPAPCSVPHRVWGLMAGQLLRSKTWDGAEHLLYNDLSGDTHLLGADALDLLRLLQAADRDEATLAAALTGGNDNDNENNDNENNDNNDNNNNDKLAPDAVATILAELTRLSLVERRAC